MSEQSERLARAIRTAAGEHNNDDLAVTQIVLNMRERIAQLEAERPDLETENNYLRADLAETEAKLAALGEQEPVRFERRSFRKGELFRDWHTSTASEVKSIGERTRFVNELGEEWIHETRKLYTTPQPAIPEGYVLVPVEPTQEMLDVILNTHDVYGFAADLYKALLDAAQETDHGN